MDFTIEVEQETDGSWLAEVMELPGVLTYGKNKVEAVSKALELALRVQSDQIQFVTSDKTMPSGSRQAVVLDLAVWQEIVTTLEELVPPKRQRLKRKRLLRAIAASQQAYQTGQVRRGTVDDLLAELAE